MSVNTRFITGIVFSFLVSFSSLYASQTTMVGGDKDDSFTSACLTRDKGFIVAGWTESTGAGGRDGWMVKYDATEKKLWEKTFGGAGNEEIADVLEDPRGNLYFCGYTTSSGKGQKDIWVFKTDKKGKVLWEVAVGGALDDYAVFMQPAVFGKKKEFTIALAGITYSEGEGGSDIKLLEFNPDNGFPSSRGVYGTAGDDFTCRMKSRHQFEFNVPWSCVENGKIRNRVIVLGDGFHREYDIQFDKRMLYATDCFIHGIITGTSKDSTGQEIGYIERYFHPFEKSEFQWDIKSNGQSLEIRDIVGNAFEDAVMGAGGLTGKKGQHGILMKFSNDGAITGIWEPYVGILGGYNTIHRLIALSDTKYLAVGASQPYSRDNLDAWMVVAYNNDVTFHKLFANAKDGFKVVTLNDGSMVVLGITPDGYGTLYKIQPDGTEEWNMKTDRLITVWDRDDVLCVLDNGTVLVSIADSIMGINPSGRRLFSIHRIYHGYNRVFGMTAVGPTGFYTGDADETVFYDLQGKEMKRVSLDADDRPKNFKLLMSGMMKDGSQVIGGYIPGSEKVLIKSYSYDMMHPVLIKYSPDGKKQWEIVMTEAYGSFSCFVEDPLGNIVVAGKSATLDGRAFSALIVSFSPEGKLIYEGIVGNTDEAIHLAVRSDGQYVLLTGGGKILIADPVSKRFVEHTNPVVGMFKDFCLQPDDRMLFVGNSEETWRENPLGVNLQLVRFDATMRCIPLREE